MVGVRRRVRRLCCCNGCPHRGLEPRWSGVARRSPDPGSTHVPAYGSRARSGDALSWIDNCSLRRTGGGARSDRCSHGASRTSAGVLITRSRVLALAATGLIGAGVLAPVVPAQAATGSCGLEFGPELAVDAPFEEFTGVLAADCAASGASWVSWDVVRPRVGWTNSLLLEGTTRVSIDCCTVLDQLGTYTVRPDVAYTEDFSTAIGQPSYTVATKAQSRASFAASRRGAGHPDGSNELRQRRPRRLPAVEERLPLFPGWHGQRGLEDRRTGDGRRVREGVPHPERGTGHLTGRGPADRDDLGPHDTCAYALTSAPAGLGPGITLPVAVLCRASRRGVRGQPPSSSLA